MQIECEREAENNRMRETIQEGESRLECGRERQNVRENECERERVNVGNS